MPSGWQICWLAGNTDQLGLTPAVCCSHPAISVFFYNSKKGPLRILEAVPPYRPHYGKWRQTPPRDPRSAHAMSPPLQDWNLARNTISHAVRTAELLLTTLMLSPACSAPPCRPFSCSAPLLDRDGTQANTKMLSVRVLLYPSVQSTLYLCK